MTPQQLKIFDFVRDRILEAGFSPSYQEIGDAFGFTATAAFYHCDTLVRAGYLARDKQVGSGPGKRVLRLAGEPDLRTASMDAILAEMARRGKTFGALDAATRPCFSRAAVSCAADCCQMQVKPGQLFCLTHWRAIPHDLQRGILAAHRRRDIVAFEQLLTRARDIADGTVRQEEAA